MTALVLAAALALRMLIPAGFMPDVSRGRIGIELCSGSDPIVMPMAGPTTAPMAGHAAMRMAMPGAVPQAGGDSGSGGHAGVPCAFAVLVLPGLAATDPVQLAIAIAFVFAAAPFLHPALLVRRVSRLRPPLRAPPRPA